MQERQIRESTTSHNRVSKYKGVTWNKSTSNWTAKLTHKGITYICGINTNDRNAAKMRDLKILSLVLNKPLAVLKRSE